MDVKNIAMATGNVDGESFPCGYTETFIMGMVGYTCCNIQQTTEILNTNYKKL